ncbi:hypothetical protein [Mucilaginibacter panaciglaebae]|uniref:Uncharacterized protein n=1 Tax=Mucilaginibacter panaciglaebae TaxID=502331 RepID=A0ABP7WS65_9SPHI
MDMQDKNFDKIFRSKLEDFEEEPSPMVWNNIADELEGKKDKRSMISYLGAAACIAVVFTAGLLFLQKDTKPEHHHNYASLVYRDSAKPAMQTVTKPAVKPQKSVMVDNSSVEKVASNSGSPHSRFSQLNPPTAPVVNNTDNEVKHEGTVNANLQLMAQITRPVTTTIKPVMPDIRLTPKTIDAIASIPAEKPESMAWADNKEAEPERKHTIHNLGGLINALVAKIDKREDKLIEFSDSDDDDAGSKITAVNLGLVKLGKH